MSRYWPIAGLRVRTERLELRSPTAADLDELAALAAGGIHDPAVMPFTGSWLGKRYQGRGFGTEMRAAVQAGRLFRLDRDAWAANQRHEVRIDGLDPCLPLLGVG